MKQYYNNRQPTQARPYRYRFKLDIRAAIQHHRDLEKHEQKLDRITQRMMEEYGGVSEYYGEYEQ